jgi:hypothetical protein
MAQRPVHITQDRWFSTLDGAVNDSTTTWTVAAGDGAGLEVSDIEDTIIHCESEKVRVTDMSGDTLTVERGYGGTTAASHGDGEQVALFQYREYFNDTARRTAATESFFAGIFEDEDGVIQDGGLQVEAEGTPSMTIVITAGNAMVAGQVVALHEDVEIEFTAPTGDPRIDTVQIDQFGIVTAKIGTEDGSPVAPTADGDALELATVDHRVGETSIKNTDDSSNGYITQTQVYL